MQGCAEVDVDNHVEYIYLDQFFGILLSELFLNDGKYVDFVCCSDLFLLWFMSNMARQAVVLLTNHISISSDKPSIQL